MILQFVVKVDENLAIAKIYCSCNIAVFLFETRLKGRWNHDSKQVEVRLIDDRRGYENIALLKHRVSEVTLINCIR